MKYRAFGVLLLLLLLPACAAPEAPAEEPPAVVEPQPAPLPEPEMEPEPESEPEPRQAAVDRPAEFVRMVAGERQAAVYGPVLDTSWLYDVALPAAAAYGARHL